MGSTVDHYGEVKQSMKQLQYFCYPAIMKVMFVLECSLACVKIAFVALKSTSVLEMLNIPLVSRES